MKLDPRINLSVRAALRGNFKPAIGFVRSFLWAITHRGCWQCGGPRENWHERCCQKCQWGGLVKWLFEEER